MREPGFLMPVANDIGGLTAAQNFKPFPEKPKTMLRWSVIFLIVAIIAGIFGFGGISDAAAGIAKVLFFIFLAGFVLMLIFGATLFKK